MAIEQMTIRAFAVASVVLIATGTSAGAQPGREPTNSAPNTYQTVEGWARLPDGRTWGSTSAVAIDKDGVSVWVGERCGANSCATSNLDPIVKFDSTGRMVRSFGAGMLLSPHGIHVDGEGNVWAVDCACTGGGGRGRGRGAGAAGARGGDTAARGRAAAADAAPAVPRGHQVYKFSPDGVLLLTLGKAGGANSPEFFFQPNAVYVAPSGEIFVSEGHGSGGDRILKFSKDGTLIKTWGERGTGPGQFNQPHALAMDSRGRLYVGDRSNNRIQIFDQDGNFIAEWYQFSRPSGIHIDAQDNIFVADSESGIYDRNSDPPRPGWLRGIRIGRATDGSVTGFIPDPNPGATSTSAAEGVSVDRNGVEYGAEVGPRALKRYVRR
jgi:sugar lactone lactonase YvrE